MNRVDRKRLEEANPHIRRVLRDGIHRRAGAALLEAEARGVLFALDQGSEISAVARKLLNLRRAQLLSGAELLRESMED